MTLQWIWWNSFVRSCYRSQSTSNEKGCEWICERMNPTNGRFDSIFCENQISRFFFFFCFCFHSFVYVIYVSGRLFWLSWAWATVRLCVCMCWRCMYLWHRATTYDVSGTFTEYHLVNGIENAQRSNKNWLDCVSSIEYSFQTADLYHSNVHSAVLLFLAKDREHGGDATTMPANYNIVAPNHNTKYQFF